MLPVSASMSETGTTFEPTLKVTTRDLDDAVEIRVRDNGIGIPAESRTSCSSRSSPRSRPGRVPARFVDQLRHRHAAARRRHRVDSSRRIQRVHDRCRAAVVGKLSSPPTAGTQCWVPAFAGMTKGARDDGKNVGNVRRRVSVLVVGLALVEQPLQRIEVPLTRRPAAVLPPSRYGAKVVSITSCGRNFNGRPLDIANSCTCATRSV